MKISRRKFLHRSGAAVVTASFAASAQGVFGQSLIKQNLSATHLDAANDALNYLKFEHFQAVVNSVFQFMATDGRSYKLQLVDAAKMINETNVKLGLQGECFALRFQSNSRSIIQPGTFAVTHESLGSFSLMVSPVGQRRNQFEAVINRINV